MVTREWGQRGNPWEFNLRDVFRWAELLIQNQVGLDWRVHSLVDAGFYR